MFERLKYWVNFLTGTARSGITIMHTLEIHPFVQFYLCEMDTDGLYYTGFTTDFRGFVEAEWNFRAIPSVCINMLKNFYPCIKPT